MQTQADVAAWGRKTAMRYEKSCGAIVYRKFHGNTEVLLVQHKNGGHWSFPKGHVEGDETEVETAQREIMEETNLEVMVDTAFREVVTYSPKRNTMKDVVYFLARAVTFDPKPQEGEIAQLKWVQLDRAHDFLTYDNDKLLINHAKPHIK